ncbi:4-(cytidine 5'-diphospho)-2-C-methyl-D-erythritol kinase [bacterium]|nr:4-(cytidine 5'-diphospho)-2-C-methyl-D-erythritol kinase [bacterium]
MAVERKARAKINLALHVTGRRADGYHLLDSIVAFAETGDRILVAPAAKLTLTVTGPMAAGLTAGPDNLVLRAARALGQGRGAAITLDKHLPVASGIGGGSADAAATLLALGDLWGCALPEPAAVLALGADVPVCLAGHAARMQGIGEIITPLTLPEAHLVLVNPGFGLATADVFRALIRRDNPAIEMTKVPLPDAAALADWLSRLRNDLQAPAERLAPGIATVIAALEAQRGCLLARMSGSGATCFGLFATAETAAAAATALARPGWWVRAAALAG